MGLRTHLRSYSFAVVFLSSIVALILASSLTVVSFTTTPLPRTETPLARFSRSNSQNGVASLTTTTSFSQLGAAIQSGDTVLVVGGTGGVGQLVTQKLAASNFQVRVTSRNKERGEETIANSSVDVVQVDVVRGPQSDVENLVKGVDGMVICVGTTAFPTLKWKDGNTPDAVDHLAVARLVQTAATTDSMKKVLLVTSIGVERAKNFPFVILNLFGVLDAKKKGEDALKQASAASSSSFDYVIVRPGQLVGGPFTNFDEGRLLQTPGTAENGVKCERGDELSGECKRDACADAVVQALESETAKNIEFCIISDEEKQALTDDEWEAMFQSLVNQ
ncbi:hypothetical protein ACA910_001340 [Epithemia clementina (nom. ined.)]